LWKAKGCVTLRPMASQSRTVLITGVTRGLGRAMAEEFVKQGHTVVGCARSRAEIEKLRKRFDKKHDFEVVDLRIEAQVESWAKRILASFNPPDLLLNNAGIINSKAPLWNISSEEFSQLIDVNIKGVTYVIRNFVPAMVARKHGVIVNFSSGWGRSASPQFAPYCATKWAIEGLTSALAQELPEGMAAVPLNPGVINTDMLRSSWEEGAASYPPPDQWARKAVPFLLALGPKDNGKQLSVPE